VRITAQLIDALTSTRLWADHFDGSLEDVFELQDKVAVSVAGVIEPALQAAEIRRSSQLPTIDLTAYDLYLRALPHWISWEKDRIMQALDLLGKAIERDPQYAPALGLSAWCHLVIDNNNWAEDAQANSRRGVVLAREALVIDADEPSVLANAAFVLAYIGEDIDAAIRLMDRSLALNPSFAFGWLLNGFLHLWAGLSDLAIQYLEASLRLNPRDRWAFQFTGIGIAHFFDRQF
jgi:tetratricopeptide (TPR) repeat protein